MDLGDLTESWSLRRREESNPSNAGVAASESGRQGSAKRVSCSARFKAHVTVRCVQGGLLHHASRLHLFVVRTSANEVVVGPSGQKGYDGSGNDDAPNLNDQGDEGG